MMNKINEIMYFVTGKPYFVVYVLSNGRKVKRFIQLAADKEKGSDLFLLSSSLKSAWWKPDFPVIDGLKFITFVDLNNAIPLSIESETEIKTSDYIVTEETKLIIKEDIEKQKKDGVKSGKPMKLVEISFPPTLLFQKVEAHFVKEIMSIPPNKNEWMMWVFIAALLVIGAIGFMYFSKGGMVSV